MLDNNYDPNWVYRDFVATRPSFFLDEEIIAGIKEGTDIFAVSTSPNITSRIFNQGQNIYTSIKQKTEERLIINGLLRYTEKNIVEPDTVPICLLDLIVLTYINCAVTVHKRNQDTLYRVAMGIEGIRKWIFGVFTHAPNNNLLYRLGDEERCQYKFIDMVLLRRCYSYLTNCYTNNFISIGEYKESCKLYLFKSRCDYIKKQCDSYHPLFSGQIIGDIICKMSNSNFANKVSCYYKNKYNNYQQLLVFSPKILDYYRSEHVFQNDPDAFYI